MKINKALFLAIYLIMNIFLNKRDAHASVTIAPSSLSLCQNTSGFFSVINSQPASSNYIWQDSTTSGWVNITNNTFIQANSDTLYLKNISTAYSNKKFRCIVDSAGMGLKKDTSAAVVLIVFPVMPHGLLNGSQTICYNTAPDTIRALNYPVNGLGWYTYQWQISTDSLTWTNISGQTTVKLKLNKLTQDQFIRILATTITGCKNDTSDVIKLNVLGVLVKPIINASQSICYNSIADTIRVQSLAQGGGNVFTYQWQKSLNGSTWSDVVAATGLKYAPGILLSTTYFRLKAIGTKGCGILISDSIKVTVFGVFNPGELNGNQTICYNTIPNAIQFFTLPTGAGTNYTYQWQVSTDSVNFVDFANSNVFSFQPNNLAQTFYYRVHVIPNTSCANGYTNIIRIKVYPLFIGASISKSQIICYNTSPDTIRMSTVPVGGSGVYTYQWQQSTDSINWININGQNTAKLKLPNLFQTTYIRLFNQCNVGCGMQISNAIKIKVFSSVYTKPRITQTQSICYNTIPDTLRLQAYASGADNKFVYQWQSSINGTTWIDVAGATGLSYKPGVLKQSTFYRINAIATFGCRSIASDSIKITVYDQLAAGQLNNNQSICYNGFPARLQFAIPPSGGGDVYAYQWQISSDSINYVNINGALFDNYQPGKLIQTNFYRVKITSINGCGEVISAALKIKVYPVYKGAEINASQNICYNLRPNNLTLRTVPSGGDGYYFYQWQIGKYGIWSNIDSATKEVYMPEQVKMETYYRLINYAGSGCGRDTSNVVKISVLPLPDTTQILGVTTVCRNQQEVRYGMAQSNSNYTYFWSTSGGKIVSNPSDHVVYINWGLRDGIDTLRLTQINKLTGCLNIIKLPVRIKFGQAPTKSKILRKENSNILFCSDSTFGVVYQWGFLTKSNNIETDIPNANLRYVMLPHNFDTTLYEYYLKTSLGDCETKSYYNKASLTGVELTKFNGLALYPNPTTGLLNIRSNSDEIETIKVYDQQLRLLSIRNAIAANSYQLSLDYSPGVYFVEVKNKQLSSFWAKVILTGN